MCLQVVLKAYWIHIYVRYYSTEFFIRYIKSDLTTYKYFKIVVISILAG